jgi:hypothetical protein
VAAYNVIVFEHQCPVCQRSATIRAQTRIAAAHDGTKEVRFSNRTYGLGELMSWYPPTDPRHAAWSAGGRALGSMVREACYAQCARCQASLCAVVHFRGLRAVDVGELLREDDWPRGFPRGARAR